MRFFENKFTIKKLRGTKKAVKKGLTKTEEHAILLPRAKIAQLVEHSTENASVVGSIPSLGTFSFLGPASIGFTG